MNSDALFGMALGLQAPWIVTDVSFKADEATGRELHLRIGFASGSKFKDDAGADCSVHDTVERQWQHLNFFEHHCSLHCKIPRITTSDGRVRNVEETSSKKGHSYVTIGVDLDESRVIHAVEGKGKDTLAGIAKHLAFKGVQAN